MATQSKLLFVNVDGEWEESSSSDILQYTTFRNNNGVLTEVGAELALLTDSSAVADAVATKSLSITTGSKSAGTGNSGSISIKTGTSFGGIRGSFEISANGSYFSDGNVSGFKALITAEDVLGLAEVTFTQAVNNVDGYVALEGSQLDELSSTALASAFVAGSEVNILAANATYTAGSVALLSGGGDISDATATNYAVHSGSVLILSKDGVAAGTGVANSGNVEISVGEAVNGGTKGSLILGGNGLSGSPGTTIISMNSNRLHNMADPVAAQDAATKAYVDAVAEGLKPKAAVQLATTAAITLSGEQTIDGVLTSSSRVLVKDQAAAISEEVTVTIQNPAFFFDVIGAAKAFFVPTADAVTHYYWLNVTDGANTQTDPTLSGTAHQVNILAIDTASDIAGKVATVIAGVTGVTSAVATLADIDIVLDAGAAVDASDQDANIAVIVSVQGANSQRVNNGIYITGAGAWTRATDFDSLTPIDEINAAYVPVQEGTTNAGKFFVQTGLVTTIGTDEINFVFFNAVASGLSGGAGINVSSGTVSIDLLNSGSGLVLVGVGDAAELAIDFATTFTIGAADALALKASDLAQTAGAGRIGILDTGSYYTGNSVEAALAEIDAQIGGLTSTTFAFAENNVLADNDFIYPALEKLDLKWGDLASVANGEGASLVGVEDSAGNFTGANVESVLAELYMLASSGAAGSYTVGTGGVTQGDLLVVSANNTVNKIDIATGSYGFAIAETTQLAAATVKALHDGQIIAGIMTGMTAGDKVYFDSTQTGTARFVDITGAPTGIGQRVWQVGVAKNATDLVIDINFIKKNS